MTPSEFEYVPPPEPKPMSEAGRLFGMFFSPGEAFKDIAKRPRWWVPVLLSSILVTAYLYLYSVQIGFDTMIRQQLDQSNSEIPAQTRTTLIRVYRDYGLYISLFSGLVIPFCVALIIALVLKVLADTVMGAGVGFKRAMAAVTYGMFPMNVLGTILSVIVMQLKPHDEFDLQNPLVFNAGAFMAEDAPRWLITLGSSLDLFSFWSMLLIAMGLAAASKKMSTGKALGMILFPWALIVIVRTGLAAAFS